ncbi:ReoY family proteolytic degradation factor [Aciduricibacillus chroicocephali]|uniref:UPF0302 protein QR721_07130 n=1 Tax=Aciduricibacillus chroicocephali TaxID=3054939 RepID=A0ABY9KUV2_9BACI|nr:ReoY family proteolytic degradation factor [Bacillaceae bacterium 44XB]
MESSVTIQDKKSFISWFLGEFRLKKRESTWILKYLLNHQEILENVHFVHDANLCPRGIVMSSQCTEDKPFCFYKNHLETVDAEKTFHDIRLNKHESLYIQLNFKNARQNALYAAVLEENPFKDELIPEEDSKIAEGILEHTLREYEKNECLKMIDDALDRHDKEAFRIWADRLEKLNINN